MPEKIGTHPVRYDVVDQSDILPGLANDSAGDIPGDLPSFTQGKNSRRCTCPGTAGGDKHGRINENSSHGMSSKRSPNCVVSSGDNVSSFNHWATCSSVKTR